MTISNFVGANKFLKKVISHLKIRLEYSKNSFSLSYQIRSHIFNTIDIFQKSYVVYYKSNQ